MPIYRIDLKVAATLYVKADDLEKAKDLARPFLDPSIPTGLTAGEHEDPPTDDIDDAYVCGFRFDDPAFPILSIGPEMTIWGRWDEDETLEPIDE